MLAMAAARAAPVRGPKLLCAVQRHKTGVGLGANPFQDRAEEGGIRSVIVHAETYVHTNISGKRGALIIRALNLLARE